MGEETMAKKIAIPWELKYKFVKGMLTTVFKGFIYEIREECGAATTLKIYENIQRRDDRAKKAAKTIKEVFKIEGNDIEAIQRWWEIYWELLEIQGIVVELSKTYARVRFPMGCAWKTDPKDIKDWFLILGNIFTKALNPKAKLERIKGMCDGDSFCEYVTTIEE